VKNIKFMVMVLLSAVMICSVSGCGSETGESENSITVPAADIVNSIVDASGKINTDTVLSKGDDTFDNGFEGLYGVDEGIVTDACIAYDSTGATSDEISILRVADKKDVSNVESALKKRLEKRASDFGEYRPEESSKAQNGVVFTCANYVMMAISDDSSVQQTAFMKAMQNV
jgi:hypothetical protein